MKSLDSLQPLALFLLRFALGIIFITHGYPKLIHGADMQSFFIEHGLPGYFVYIGGVLEMFGGGLLLLGLSRAGRRSSSPSKCAWPSGESTPRAGSWPYMNTSFP